MNAQPWLLRLRLAGRYLRSGAVRTTAVPLGLVVLMLSLAFVVLNAATLSNPQVVQRTLGAYDSAIGLGNIAVLTDDPGVTAGPQAAVRRAGGSDIAVSIESRDVRIDLPHAPAARYLETSDPGKNFPDRYRLVTGRWPTAPGEVAVTKAVPAVGSDGQLRVLSGAGSWQVVGTVTDNFARKTALILGGPGTWQALPWALLRSRQPELAGSLTIYSNGTNLRLAEQGLAQLPQSTAKGTPASEIIAQLEQQTTTRTDLLGLRRTAGYQRFPLAFDVPALVFLPLGVLVAFGLPWRRTTRQLGVLRGIGLRRKDALLSVALATTASLAAATAGGLLVGWSAGALLRPVFLSALGQPLSPLDPPWPLLKEVTLLVFGATTVMAALLAASMTGVTSRVLRLSVPRPYRFRHARRVGSAVAFSVLIYSAGQVDTAAAALRLIAVTTLCVSLVMPSSLATALGRLPVRGLKSRLVREGLRLDRVRVVITLVLVAATAGPLISILVINQSLTATEIQRAISLVPPGVVLLTTSGIEAMPVGVIHIVESALTPKPLQPAISVSGIGGTHGVLTVKEEGLGNVVAVETADDFEKLNGSALSPRQRTVLTSGGVLVWGPKYEDSKRQLYLQPTTGTAPPVKYGPLESVVAPMNRFWGEQWKAVLLNRTAKELGLPLNKDSVVLTGLSAQQVSQAKPALIAKGYTTSYAQIYEQPFRFGLSFAEKATALGLSALLIAVLGALGRSQYRSLHSYASMLMALGLKRSWIGQVLVSRILLIVGCALLPASVIGILPVAVLFASQAGLVLSIPWASVFGILGAAALTTALCASVGLYRLRARAYLAAF